MKKDKESIPVQVYSGTPWETTMVKNLLISEGIESFLKDETMGTLAPMYASPGGANPVTVFVAAKDFDKALDVIRKYQENQQEEEDL